MAVRTVSGWIPVALLMSHHLATTWLKSCSEPYLRASRFRTIFSHSLGLRMHFVSSGALLSVDVEKEGSRSRPPLSGVK